MKKSFLTLLKQKEIFKKLANEKMTGIQDLSKQISYRNLFYYFKSKSAPIKFLRFKTPLSFYRNIKDIHITLKKVEKDQKEFKSDVNEKVRGNLSLKSSDQFNTIKYIKTFYESREKVIKLFNDYSNISSKAKHTSKQGEGLKMLTPKQMLQRLPIALAQVKAGNNSENLLNEIKQIVYSLYQSKKITKKYTIT